jgi:hypothetical protein
VARSITTNTTMTATTMATPRSSSRMWASIGSS